MKRGLGTLLVGAVVALVVTAVAVASGGSDSVLKAYGGAGNYSSQVSTGTPSGGTLPFTGLDLGIALAIALGLVALGVAMRRAGRRPQD